MLITQRKNLSEIILRRSIISSRIYFFNACRLNFFKTKISLSFHRDNASVRSLSVISYTEAVRMSAEKSFSRTSCTAPDGPLYTKIRARRFCAGGHETRGERLAVVGWFEALCARFPAGGMSDTGPRFAPDSGRIWATAVASRRKGGGLPGTHPRFHSVRQRRSFKGMRPSRHCEA